MSRQSRLRLIKKIETLRGSRVISYITGDRKGLETKISTDVFPFILEHLEKIGKVEHIDLFLYTPGGVSNAGTGLVALFREYCNRFSVIIPFKAHSAGTLIALGADSIVMGKLAQLSPVDPSIHSPYNPPVPGPQQPGATGLLPVNVEEVIGYLNLAREEGKITDDNAMASIFRDLSAKVHPLALGSVFRARAQIEMLATQLLTRHMGESKAGRVRDIVKKLTSELYSHDYIIGKKEAKETLELNVEDVDENTEKAIWSLYGNYEDLLELTIPMTPDVVLGDNDEIRRTFNRAVIESRFRIDAFQSDQEFKRIQTIPSGAPGPVIGYQSHVYSQQWNKGVKV